MGQKVKFFNRINVRVLLVLIALFAAVGAAVSALDSYMLHSVYEQAYTEKVLTSNRLIANLVNADEVDYYVDMLAAQDGDFKLRQRRFSEKRDELEALQEAGAPIGEQQPLINWMRAFHADMENLEGADYVRTLDRLKKVKEASGAKYVYLFADTGVTDADGNPLATYIFDAEENEDFSSVDSDGLGTTSAFEPEALRIYATKEQMDTVDYYDQPPYGELYYAYAPILDSGGEVIAVVGTDLEVGGMHQAVGRSLAVGNALFIAFAAVACLALYWFLNKFLAKPLRQLTKTALRLADGEVYTSVPSALMEHKTELGLLAHTVDDMAGVYQNMIKTTGGLLKAAGQGMLDARSDPARFKGDIAKVISQMNATMDATTMYLNGIPEGLFIMSPGLDLFFRNKKYADTFGDMDAEGFMRVVLDLPGTSRLELSDALEKLLARDAPAMTALFSGAVFSVMFRQVDLDDFMEPSVLAVAVDITDLTREKMNAQAANNAKSEFLSRVSHELRTPMNVILGMSTMGLRDDAPAGTLERFRKIDEASRHLLSIINDVLDMSRIESGRMELENEPFELHGLLGEAAAMFALAAEQKGLELKLEMDAALPAYVRGDAQKLKQVLINLIGNSLKFTETGGVTVTAKPLADVGGSAVVFFSVSDTGIGMSPEFIKKIFTPFEQEAVYLQRTQKGTGLGLPICKNMVGLMGGEISVASERGKGSTFAFSIPLARARAADLAGEAAGGEAEAVDLAGMRVLLVDDLEINRLIFIEMLADQGLAVTQAADGAEAVALFEQSEPGWFDIVFMDIQMPVMDGYEATRRIRESGRPDSGIPIIAMTANALKQDVEKAADAGMDGHVAKPIEYEACVLVMRKFFHG